MRIVTHDGFLLYWHVLRSAKGIQSMSAKLFDVFLKQVSLPMSPCLPTIHKQVSLPSYPQASQCLPSYLQRVHVCQAILLERLPQARVNVCKV